MDLSMPSTSPLNRQDTPNSATGQISPGVSQQTAGLNSSGGSIDGSMAAPRRRSTREIKRPKFDDEMVESSFPLKSPRKHTRSSTEKSSDSPTPMCSAGPLKAEQPPERKEQPKRKEKQEKEWPPLKKEQKEVAKVCDSSKKPSNNGTKRERSFIGREAERRDSSLTPPPRKHSHPDVKPSTSAAVVKPIKPIGGKSIKERAKSPAPTHSAALEDVGRWSPTDDLALITSVLQVNDLTKVYAGLRFSCKFTLAEIQQRWYALMYDPLISKLAMESMRQLTPEVIQEVQSNTLFTKNEEQLICGINPTLGGEQPSLETFQELLNKHADVFHEARTARSLFGHWQMLRQYRLLNEQKQLPLPVHGEHNDHAFSEIEENLEAEPDIIESRGHELSNNELGLAERKLNREIRVIENEGPRLHVLTEAVTGINPPDFDSSTMAVLRGRLVRFLMRSKEVTLGRSSKVQQVDIDLSLEGPAFKISRKQATIKLRASGEFCITNDGKRPLFVDGKPLVCGSKTKLNNNAVIEIANVRLVFLVNSELISTFATEATKMMVT